MGRFGIWLLDGDGPHKTGTLSDLTSYPLFVSSWTGEQRITLVRPVSSR